MDWVEEDYDRSEFMGGDSDRPEPYERPGNGKID